MRQSQSRPKAVRGGSVMQACDQSWYCRGSNDITTKTPKLLVYKGSRGLFRDYLSNTVVVGVARSESSVGVPPRRLFRYGWMDVNVPTHPQFCFECNADHRTMTKFTGRADAGYGQVRGVVERWIKEYEGSCNVPP
jgi:hypothetical protein